MENTRGAVGVPLRSLRLCVTKTIHRLYMCWCALRASRVFEALSSVYRCNYPRLRHACLGLERGRLFEAVADACLWVMDFSNVRRG